MSTANMPTPQPGVPADAAILQKEYDLVNMNFRQLMDIRFKLLGFVPSVAALANFQLLSAALKPGENAGGSDALTLLFGIAGFMATLGIAIYDQRNSELYNALSDRAKRIEDRLGLTHGQFRSRPRRGKRLFGLFLLGHDTGLALIYGSVLGLWFVPIIYAGLKIFSPNAAQTSPRWAFVGGAAMSVVFITEFLRFDGAWKRAWKKLWPEE